MRRLAILVAALALVGASSAHAAGGDVAAQTTPLLNTFWTALLDPVTPFQSPTFDLYGAASRSTACGPLPAYDAVYCPLDGHVYFNTALLGKISRERHGFYAAVTVLAHEWGHAVQEQTGILAWAMHSEHSYYMGTELQADCFAGMFDRYAEQQGFLSTADFPGAIRQMTIWADRTNLSPRAEGTHGTAKRRMAWFTLGYRTGNPDVCFAVYRKLYGSGR